MESTGVCWQPVFNLLEGSFGAVLANAHHIKAVPGRKTDVNDCGFEVSTEAGASLSSTHGPHALVLELLHLDALMIEAIDRIFESPVRKAILEKCRQSGLASAQIPQERLFFGTLDHIGLRLVVGGS